MKIVEKKQATDALATYTEQVGNGPVVVTEKGKPVAVLVPVENADLETIALSTNPGFLALIERSRARMRTEGGIPSDEIRRRLGVRPRKR
jgi:PHD/YefM family antitoxin component YafN of YafNO toxin-antitoxin module